MLKVDDSNRAKVLAALYNRAKPLGKGYIQYDPKPMTEEEAAAILKRPHDMYFDYLQGRVMKIDLKGPELNFNLYNRDNGPGAGEEALNSLEQSKRA